MLDTSSTIPPTDQAYKANTSENSPSKHATFKEKMKWLDEVCADKSLSIAAKLVLTRLVIKHHNTETGRCDPSHDTLAEGLGMSRRYVVKLIQAAKDAGWISFTTRDGTSNSYRLEKIRMQDHAASEPMNDNSPPQPVNDSSHPLRTIVHTPPVNDNSHKPSSFEPSKEPNISDQRKKLSPGKNERAKFIPLPDDWKLDPEKAKIAKEAGLDHKQLEATHEIFIAHQRAKGNRNANWNEAWRLWCLKAAALAKKEGKPKPVRTVAI